MPFYRRHAEQRGYLVACPTAVKAPWSQRDNEALVRAVLDEMKAASEELQDRLAFANSP